MKREFDEYDDDKFENLEEAEQIYGAMAPLVKDVGKHGRQFKKAMETLAPLMEEAFPRKLGAVIYARLFKKWLRDGILEEDEKYLFERRAKNSAPFTPEELRRKKEVGNAANYIFNKLIAYVYGEPDVIGIKEGSKESESPKERKGKKARIEEDAQEDGHEDNEGDKMDEDVKEGEEKNKNDDDINEEKNGEFIDVKEEKDGGSGDEEEIKGTRKSARIRKSTKLQDEDSADEEEVKAPRRSSRVTKKTSFEGVKVDKRSPYGNKRKRQASIKEGTQCDLYETTPATVRVLVPYISQHLNPGDRIFESCSCNDSAITSVFREEGYDVIENDLYGGGEDAITMSYPECQAVITNPPFGIKRDILQKTIEQGNPYALLLPAECLWYKGLHMLLRTHGVKVIIMIPPPLFMVNGKLKKVVDCAWFLGGWPDQVPGKLDSDWVVLDNKPRIPSSLSLMSGEESSRKPPSDEVYNISILFPHDFTMYCDKCVQGISEDDNLVCQGEMCNDVHMCADCAYVNADLSQILCGDCVGNDEYFETYRARVHDVAAGAVSPRAQASASNTPRSENLEASNTPGSED